LNHRDRLREEFRRRYAANPEPFKAQAKRWREANYEKARAAERLRERANAAARQAWRIANPDKVRDMRRRSYAKLMAEDPEAYRARKAEVARKWRELNRERAREISREGQRRWYAKQKALAAAQTPTRPTAEPGTTKEPRDHE
jgi:hypothetical protein